MTEHIGGDNQFEVLSRSDGSVIEAFNVWHIQDVYKRRYPPPLSLCFSAKICQTTHDFFPASDESKMELFGCFQTLFKFINRKFVDIETITPQPSYIAVPLMTHDELVIEVKKLASKVYRLGHELKFTRMSNHI